MQIPVLVLDARAVGNELPKRCQFIENFWSCSGACAGLCIASAAVLATTSSSAGRHIKTHRESPLFNCPLNP